MSRRQHVVRTEDKAGVGNPRSLGGCQVLCGTEGPRATLLSGSVNPDDEVLIAPVPVTSPGNYRRCLVSATIRNVTAWVPDPIYSGSFSVQGLAPAFPEALSSMTTPGNDLSKPEGMPLRAWGTFARAGVVELQQYIGGTWTALGAVTIPSAGEHDITVNVGGTLLAGQPVRFRTTTETVVMESGVTIEFIDAGFNSAGLSWPNSRGSWETTGAVYATDTETRSFIDGTWGHEAVGADGILAVQGSFTSGGLIGVQYLVGGIWTPSQTMPVPAGEVDQVATVDTTAMPGATGGRFTNAGCESEAAFIYMRYDLEYHFTSLTGWDRS